MRIPLKSLIRLIKAFSVENLSKPNTGGSPKTKIAEIYFRWSFKHFKPKIPPIEYCITRQFTTTKHAKWFTFTSPPCFHSDTWKPADLHTSTSGYTPDPPFQKRKTPLKTHWKLLHSKRFIFAHNIKLQCQTVIKILPTISIFIFRLSRSHSEIHQPINHFCPTSRKHRKYITSCQLFQISCFLCLTLFH